MNIKTNNFFPFISLVFNSIIGLISSSVISLVFSFIPSFAIGAIISFSFSIIAGYIAPMIIEFNIYFYYKKAVIVKDFINLKLYIKKII